MENFIFPVSVKLNTFRHLQKGGQRAKVNIDSKWFTEECLFRSSADEDGARNGLVLLGTSEKEFA